MPDVETPPKPITNVIGRRVALGPMTRALIPRLYRWLNDLETTRALGDIAPPMTLEQVAAWYERSVASPDIAGFTVYDAATWEAVGTTALLDIDYRNRSAEFGIIIGEPSARGQGIGTEVTSLMADYAFTALGLHSLWLTTYTFNVAGLRAYEKAGFREIGRRRECFRHAGRAWDKVYMDCLATEFTSPVLGKVFAPDEPRARDHARYGKVTGPPVTSVTDEAFGPTMPRLSTGGHGEAADTDARSFSRPHGR
jgi:RimJ/RimL family protein N-acetyltransferase